MHWSIFVSWPKTDGLLNTSLQPNSRKTFCCTGFLIDNLMFAYLCLWSSWLCVHLARAGADDGSAVRAASSRCHGNRSWHSPARLRLLAAPAAHQAKRTGQTFPAKGDLWNAAFGILRPDQGRAAGDEPGPWNVPELSATREERSSSRSRALRPREQGKNHS